jgi:polygalacturonase
MLANTTDIEVSHIEIKNSPDWTVHFSSCTRVHAHHLTVLNPLEPNADGMDIDSSQDVLVEENYFSVGDDALCVKSGIDYFGRRYGRPSKNILFRNNVIGTGHGITIGSETSGGVENVTFDNITMDHTGTGIRMKSMRGRGGEVNNITYRNINMKEIDGECIQMTLNYKKAAPTNKTATPIFDNILIENVVCEKGHASYFLDGLPEQSILGVTFRNVSMGTEVGKESSCSGIVCVCEGSPSCPSCCKSLPP